MSGLAALLLLTLLAQASPPASGPRVVTRAEILAAMLGCEGFDPTATTNGARFQAAVLLHLLRANRAPDIEESLLFISHDDWFAAYLERTGLRAESAPLFVRLAHEYGQDMEIDGRRDRVVERVLAGPEPLLAANVTIGWPATRGKDRYSYEDKLSVPDLKVTNERIMSYYLLDYGDVVVYDQVEGLRGRPTEGFLGVLFDLIGEGRVQWSRMAISADGLQVSRARAVKGVFRVESTVTVFPDGRVEKDLPAGRADLLPVERRLLQPRKLRYRPRDRQRAPTE